MAHGNLYGYLPTQAVTQQIDLADFKIRQQGGNVIRHLLELNRPLDVCGMPMPLQLHADHLVRLRQTRNQGTEHPDDAEAAVDQHERRAFAVDLIIHLQPVHRCVATFYRQNHLSLPRR